MKKEIIEKLREQLNEQFDEHIKNTGLDVEVGDIFRDEDAYNKKVTSLEVVCLVAVQTERIPNEHTDYDVNSEEASAFMNCARLIERDGKKV